MAATSERNVLFEIRGLTKVYRMGTQDIFALRGINLILYQAEFVVLLGASGSGKSTLVNILGGLDVPTSGEVIYLGQPLAGYGESALTRYRRSQVGFVFQYYNLIPSLTALENVALVTEIADDPMSPEEALAMVGLQDRGHHFPAQLSGGEQQRVAGGRAIATRPPMLRGAEAAGARGHNTRVGLGPGHPPNARKFCCAMNRPELWMFEPAFWCCRRLTGSIRNWEPARW
jgi:putative ABC transport system ATP-binding protein